MKKINQLILLTFILFLSLLMFGCGTTCIPINPMCFDIFYKIEKDKVKDNKVIVALGQRYYDDGETQSIDPNAKPYDNFMITIYVDSMEEYTEQIKISREDFFSYEYRMLMSKKREYPTAASDYHKTYEFNLSDYNVSRFIKFIVSYTDHDDRRKDATYQKELYLYGKTIDSTFIVEDSKLMHDREYDAYSAIFYKIEEDKVKDNKVTVALGSHIYDDTKIPWLDFSTQKRYDNFMITVYVDTEEEYTEQIKISREDFFSYEYRVVMPWISGYPTAVADYYKTYEFNLEKYNISEYITFTVSYTKHNEGIEDNIYQTELKLYGKTVDSTFIVERYKLNEGWKHN